MSIIHENEELSNAERAKLMAIEPKSLRTYTPTQLVISLSAGVFHFSPEGRRLYDFTSGVLVANLGHNPVPWIQRFFHYMAWPDHITTAKSSYFPAIPMTTYNAITPLEVTASQRLVQALQGCPGGQRLEVVMWAASGSEAVTKALWAAMAFDINRPMILATRHGFHGKKGLAGAVTGSEVDHERDPRVKFISFPMHECRDVTLRDEPFDVAPYLQELNAFWAEHGPHIGTLITEPYLGGGGSYHPPKAYLQAVQNFCRAKNIVFILDEVQANFGRTGDLFAYETYGLEPDIVVLGKGLGNGVPVAAAVGRKDIFDALNYGEASDTWSANPLNCASVLATLDEFQTRDILAHSREASALIEAGLMALKALPFVAHVRGEKGGMVWGVEMQDYAGKTGPEWANAFVLAAYQGEGTEGIHLLGPLAKKVVRISPPLVMTTAEASDAMALLNRVARRLVEHSHTHGNRT
jgi:4-aminobutyrate aminotransferase-like enzyme